MNARSRPLLIVTLPARDVRSARRQCRAAHAAGADVAEIRFDRWPAAHRSRLRGLFPAPLPLLATLRSHAEGGDGPDGPVERSDWLSRVRTQPFDYVDLEVVRDRIPTDAPGRGPRIIASRHFPAGTDLSEVVDELAREVPEGTIHKVIAPAAVGEMLDRLVPALGTSGGPGIVHTTGPSGPLLRAWAKRFGMRGVFAALPRADEGGSEPVEPSQLPADRVRRWLDGPSDAPLFAVVGRPIAHSRSPAIHHRWMATARRIGLYVALEFGTEDELRASLPGLAVGGFRGLNVTHPFKALAYDSALERSEAAERCRCANTLTFGPNGPTADNTDLPAMRRRLDELEAEGRWDGRRALVVGAGGAARAALAALEDRGAAAEVLARDGAAAEAIARSFHARPAGGSKGAPPQLMIHATTVGRNTSRLAVDLRGRIRRGGYVLDYVYAPIDPSIARAARTAGARYEDGSRLLVYSAAESYRRWWGDDPSSGEVEAALAEVGA